MQCKLGEKIQKSFPLFTKKVLDIVRKIPKGKVLSYKEVAQLAGNCKACRAVGNILNKNYDPAIPCHRVICSNGAIGGYNRGIKAKIKKLKSEHSLHFLPAFLTLPIF